MRALTITLAAAILVGGGWMSGAARGDQWGDLSGMFVLDGQAPAPVPLVITKDKEFCGKHPLVDESLVVGDGGALANVALFLYVKRGDKPPAPHPDYAKTAAEPVAIANENCRYEPHFVLLRTTQPLLIRNADPIGHNTKIDCFTNTPVNPIIPAGAELTQPFPLEERLPVAASCSIHPWMNGWILVRESPYMAVTGPDGKFVIPNLPVGTWTFQVWHERSGYLTEVTVGGKKTEWEKGRAEFTIDDDGLDLGVIKVPVAAFEKD